MKIAMVTPWMPQASGIADYAYDLSEGLLATQHFIIDVYTSEKNPKPLTGVHIFSIDVTALPDLTHYDLVVYQMGNHIDYNGFILMLIERFPGVVHLHDLVLHHLFATLLLNREDGDRSDYNNLLSNYYSKLTMQLVNHLIDVSYFIWEKPDVIDIPLFEPVLAHATACIVHSQYIKRRIHDRFMYLPVKVLGQVYANMDAPVSPAPPTGPLVWGLFGHIIPSKQSELVVDVLREIAQHHPVKLIVVGNADTKLETLLDECSKESRHFTYEYQIDTELAVFNQHLQSIDVSIVLRNPSMGEMSAIVSKVMQMGKPCIVSNTCTYAELPEHIIKISTDQNQRADLYAAILKLLTDKKYRSILWKQAHAYALQEMNYQSIVNDYTHCLFHLYNLAPKSLIDGL